MRISDSMGRHAADKPEMGNVIGSLSLGATRKFRIRHNTTRESQTMQWIKAISRLMLAALMVGAGVMHFLNPSFFEKIVPPYLPFHKELVAVSGAIEILLGVLLIIPNWSRLAAWGVIALLIAVFPANIYVFQHQEIVPASSMAHLIRLLLQCVLILWAYWLTRPAERPSSELLSSGRKRFSKKPAV